MDLSPSCIPNISKMGITCKENVVGKDEGMKKSKMRLMGRHRKRIVNVCPMAPIRK